MSWKPEMKKYTYYKIKIQQNEIFIRLNNKCQFLENLQFLQKFVVELCLILRERWCIFWKTSGKFSDSFRTVCWENFLGCFWILLNNFRESFEELSGSLWKNLV